MALGWRQIRTWTSNRVLGMVGVETLMLGTSRKARDIVRMSVELRARRRLEKRWGDMIDTSPAAPCGPENRTVWICWLQGMERAPEVVKRCYASALKWFEGWNIVVLTEDNLADYAELPDFILDKHASGTISHAQFSDLLRVDLLSRLGGLWLDATVLCTGGLPKAALESDLYLYQILPPADGGRSIRVSSWLIWARPGCRVLIETRKLLWAYWQRENRLCDYFLLHLFMSMVLDRRQDDARRVPPACFAMPHALQSRLFEPYDPAIWAAIQEQTPFHKVTYKLNPADVARKGTFYDALLR